MKINQVRKMQKKVRKKQLKNLKANRQKMRKIEGRQQKSNLLDKIIKAKNNEIRQVEFKYTKNQPVNRK